MQAAATPTAAPQPPATVVGVEGVPGAAAMLTAMREQRRELYNQLESLEEKREELQRDLQQSTEDADKVGLQARLKEVDARILAVDQQIASAEQAVAQAAAVPGAVVERPPVPRSGPPEEAIIMGGLVMLAAVIPISLAYARRIWKRAGTVIAPVPQEVRAQLDGLSNAVETIGLEVERIGEGQRFITRVLAEQKQPERLGG